MRGSVSARMLGVVLFAWGVLATAPCPAALADRPSSEDAFEVYQQVGAWLREQSLPDATAQREERAIDPEGCAGAAIVLRLSGQVIGRSEVIREDGTAVWHAATDVWQQAYPELISEIPNDALYDQRLSQRLERVTIDLQLAGELVPLPSETFSSVALLINPGLQGAAARSGDAIAGVFPSTVLNFPSTADAGFDPSERALRLATTRLGLPPVDLPTIRRSDEVTLYRFDVVHLAQSGPGVPPSFLARGGRLVSEAAVTVANLRSAADSAAEYLMRLEWPGEEPIGMLGSYRATANRYEPYIAPPREQATAAFALARYANTSTTAPARARHAAEYAAWLLGQLAIVVDDEVDPRSEPIALATWLLAWAELQTTGAELNDEGREELGRYALRAAEDLLGDSMSGIVADSGEGARALRAYALALASEHLDGDLAGSAADRARAEVRALFRELPVPQLVAAMPWLGWAELELAPEDGNVPASIALREMRDLIWEFQVDPISAGSEDADFVGGIVFSRGSTQLPTWQSLRAIGFVATMLGDQRLTDEDELFAHITPLIRSMRFVMQLSASSAEGHMYAQPERAIGGIRLAIWDQTISVDATSLGLLAICETLEALEARGGD